MPEVREKVITNLHFTLTGKTASVLFYNLTYSNRKREVYNFNICIILYVLYKVRKGIINMDYSVEIRDIEPVRIAFTKYKGNVEGANKVFPSVFMSVGGKANGAPFICYYVMDPVTKIGEMELCVPTAEMPNASGIEVKEMPRIKALCVTHEGPYETMQNAYAALDRFAIERKLILMPPFREVFIKGPGMIFKGNPEKYITEIQFPFKEA
jgi:effector-binding domain-containing protein